MPSHDSPSPERFLLAALIRDGLPLPEGIEPLTFVEPIHQDIASAIKSLQEESAGIDELTVTLRLRDRGSAVTPVYLSDLVNEVGYTPYNLRWAQEVKRRSLVENVQLVARKLSRLASEPGAEPAELVEQTKAHLDSLAAQPEKLQGPEEMGFDDLMGFDRLHDPNTVLGNRWLCKGGSLLIVGQSGTGKSSLAMQASILWCVGRHFFGIAPVRPLRIVILQAENDRGDVAEAFQDCVAGAFLHEPEMRTLRENLKIYRDTTSVGQSFPPTLRRLIRENAADVVLVDPLLSFAGIDVSDQEQASHFLRHDLAPILLETGAVLIAMHHTGKPRSAKDKEGQTVADLAYQGLGSSEFTNYFREVAVLARCPGDEPIYNFALTKRRFRAKLQDSAGNYRGGVTIRHSREPGVIRWEYAPEIDQATPDEKPRDQAKGSRGRNSGGF